jgi:hypothetical protein
VLHWNGGVKSVKVGLIWIYDFGSEDWFGHGRGLKWWIGDELSWWFVVL